MEAEARNDAERQSEGEDLIEGTNQRCRKEAPGRKPEGAEA